MKYLIHKKKSRVFILCLILYCIYLLLRKRRRKRYRRKRRYTKQLYTRTNYKHRIIFGGCGNLLVYQMGVMKAVLEHFDDMEIFKKCQFEGISGGMAVCGFVCSVVNGMKDMDHYYNEYGSKPALNASNRSFGMLFTTSSLIHELGLNATKGVIELNNNKIPTFLQKNQVCGWVSTINLNRKKIEIENKPMYTFPEDYNEHTDSENLQNVIERGGSIMCASSYIPFLLSKWFYTKIDGFKCIDGSIAQRLGDKSILTAKNRHKENTKILYINIDFESKRPYEKETLDNGNIVYYLDLWRLEKFTPKDFWIWGNKKWADNLYQGGYQTAQKNMNQIMKTFDEFLKDE